MQNVAMRKAFKTMLEAFLLSKETMCRVPGLAESLGKHLPEQGGLAELNDALISVSEDLSSPLDTRGDEETGVSTLFMRLANMPEPTVFGYVHGPDPFWVVAPSDTFDALYAGYVELVKNGG